MPQPKTMFDKIWERHAIVQEEDETLLYIDRCLIHEGSSHSFANLAEAGRRVARPKQVFAFADHYVPSDPQQRARGVSGIPDLEIRNMVELLDRNAPLVEIPEAHHHLLLDQPLAFVSALRAILADWEHTLPRRGR